jgi:hypothetical protein
MTTTDPLPRHHASDMVADAVVLDEVIFEF